MVLLAKSLLLTPSEIMRQHLDVDLMKIGAKNIIPRRHILSGT